MELFIPYVESATGIGDKAAGYMLTGTLAAFAVGRFGSAWLMRHFHAQRMLVVYSIINVVLGLVRSCIPVGWAPLPADHEPVYVHHVPDHLCAGPEGHGREDQDRRIAAGDGDLGRRRADQADGHCWLTRACRCLTWCRWSALPGGSLWLAGAGTQTRGIGWECLFRACPF